MTSRLVFVFATLFLTSVVLSGPVNENSGERPEICSLSLEPGACGINMIRFYYDVEKEKCIPFLYGGCGGNENRFPTQGSCMETCKVKNV